MPIIESSGPSDFQVDRLIRGDDNKRCRLNQAYRQQNWQSPNQHRFSSSRRFVIAVVPMVKLPGEGTAPVGTYSPPPRRFLYGEESCSNPASASLLNVQRKRPSRLSLLIMIGIGTAKAGHPPTSRIPGHGRLSWFLSASIGP